MYKEVAVTFALAAVASAGLYLFEHALVHESGFSVLVAAWVTISLLNHLSANKPQQIPIDKPYATAHPRKFMAKRILRAALLAVVLFLDVYTSSHDEVLSKQTGLSITQTAEDSVRCGGASIAFIFVVVFQRNLLLPPQLGTPQKLVFLLAGLSLSVGPLLGMVNTEGRVLAAVTAGLRVLWMCLLSSHAIVDVTNPSSTVHVLRVLTCAVVYSVFANPNSCLMFSGLGLGVTCFCLFSMQSPIMALSVVTLGVCMRA
jgi:hypothetical protein